MRPRHTRRGDVLQLPGNLPPASPFTVRRRLGSESGAATAEYVIATMAAVAFAGMLVVIMRSDEIRQLLTGLVQQALTVP